MNKSQIVAIVDSVTNEVCGYLSRNEKGQPTCITGHLGNAYHFTGSRSVDLVTPDHAGQYFCQEHRRVIFTATGEETRDYGYEIQDCYN